ncbi:MAG: HepT-like ribonuclease domain-containing protein [Bacteroidota bacterium]
MQISGRQLTKSILFYLTKKISSLFLKTRKAIERNVEIIGEAANRIIKQQPDIAITDIKKIIVTRNRIIHGYDSVSDEIIWSIVTKHLVKLQEEIEELLK